MNRTLPAEDVPGHPDFRRLATVPGVRVDLRYDGTNNFAGRNLYAPMDCGWLHREAAGALAASAAWLAREQPDCTLLVLDALRPQRVQESIWASLDDAMRRYFADPARGSIHSFGMAVDVTLAGADGRELDMGTGFDCMDERSHPVLEEGFLVTGALQPAHVENRALLRDAMAAGGWVGIPTEWWHFDCGDRAAVRASFARVL